MFGLVLAFAQGSWESQRGRASRSVMEKEEMEQMTTQALLSMLLMIAEILRVRGDLDSPVFVRGPTCSTYSMPDVDAPPPFPQHGDVPWTSARGVRTRHLPPRCNRMCWCGLSCDRGPEFHRHHRCDDQGRS